MIPKDKQGHFVVGFLLAVTTGWISLWLGLGLAAGWGAWKEWRDNKDPEHHTVELMDFVATVIGGVVGIIPYLILG